MAFRLPCYNHWMHFRNHIFNCRMDRRDAITRKHFNQRIDFRVTSDHVFGGIPFDANLAARFTGALDGSTVTMAVDKPGEQAVFTVTHPLLAQPAERILEIVAGARLLVVNNDLRFTHTNSGLGTRMLAHQVETARSIGATSITLWAGAGFDKGLPLNGIYTWARCGFDANLPYPGDAAEKYIRFKTNAVMCANTQARVEWLRARPPEFQGAARVLDVMVSDAGRQWWRTCPDGCDMDFDTRVGSRSSQVLERYLIEKNICTDSTLAGSAGESHTNPRG